MTVIITIALCDITTIDTLALTHIVTTRQENEYSLQSLVSKMVSKTLLSVIMKHYDQHIVNFLLMYFYEWLFLLSAKAQCERSNTSWEGKKVSNLNNHQSAVPKLFGKLTRSMVFFFYFIIEIPTRMLHNPFKCRRLFKYIMASQCSSSSMLPI